jgi:hypothetical protein
VLPVQDFVSDVTSSLRTLVYHAANYCPSLVQSLAKVIHTCLGSADNAFVSKHPKVWTLDVAKPLFEVLDKAWSGFWGH